MQTMPTRKIRLSKGLFAVISEEDFERVSQFKWCASFESYGNNRCYAIRRDGRIKIRMHRFIMGLTKDSPLVVDHIDGDGLDNRRENLEIVTAAENTRRAHRAKKLRGDHGGKRKA